MHIPDGFINNQTSVSLIVASLAIGGLAVKHVKESLFEKTKAFSSQLATNIGVNIGNSRSVHRLKHSANQKIQKMALVAAFVFATQMFNFPVASGTSGHLIGGVLAAIVLGPWAGMLMISTVLAVQALMFGDGGIIAMGANIFNMGIVAGVGGYYLYTYLKKIIKNEYLVVALASWSSVVAAAIFCSLELAISKTINLGSVMVAMISVHALIGLGEAMITILAIKFLFSERYEQKK